MRPFISISIVRFYTVRFNSDYSVVYVDETTTLTADEKARFGALIPLLEAAKKKTTVDEAALLELAIVRVEPVTNNSAAGPAAAGKGAAATVGKAVAAVGAAGAAAYVIMCVFRRAK